MFERFTEQARQVVVKAQDEARAMKHNYLGTEHLLLGLLVVPGIARDVLTIDHELTIEWARERVLTLVAEGDEVMVGQIPFTPRSRKVLEAAHREALSLGHRFIGPEHILLGLAKETEGVAARVLVLGTVPEDYVRDLVLRRFAAEQATRPTVDEPPAKSGPRCKQALALYGGLFVCQGEDADGHTDHVEHGDGWTMRWTA